MRADKMIPIMKVLLFSVLLSAPLLAQPAFEVVSIHRVPPNAEPVFREQDFTPVKPGGQYTDSRTNLFFLIAFAYDVKNPATQLTGLPNWAEKEEYSIAAKPAESFPSLPPGENREQVRMMMRAMLAERFYLQMRTETRREPVLALTLDKGGIKIKEVSPPVPPEKETPVGMAAGDSGGRMIGRKATTGGIARALTVMMKRLVVDQTGVRGYYDIDIHWTATDAPPGLGAEGEALIVSNLQSQLGLRLTKMVAPVDYWVVKRIERPTDN